MGGEIMNHEAKYIQISWRRRLFGFHLLMWLIVRLAVGSLDQMPPAGIYDGLHLWGFIVAAHGLLLAIVDGRDHAELAFRPLNWLIEPRERRWSLLIIDAALWIIFTMAIASRTISLDLLIQYMGLISLVWLALTAVGLAHAMLVIYAEVYERASRKRKRDEKVKPALELENGLPVLVDDGELADFAEEILKRQQKR
jgi:hypothetical protein